MSERKRIKDLEKRVKALEEYLSKFMDQVQKEPYRPSYPRYPTYPVPVPNNCSLCGLELGKVMGYCCPNIECPTGLGPTIC